VNQRRSCFDITIGESKRKRPREKGKRVSDGMAKTIQRYQRLEDRVLTFVV
jgi:hypothetical protein